MKKKILAIAMMVFAVTGFSAMAKCPKADKCDKSDCTADSVCTYDGKQCDKAACRPNPFEGMTLTDAQKAQLGKLKAQRDSMRMARAKDFKAKRAAADSVKMADRRADRLEYLREVKEIVGPDQYVIFLENMVVNGQGGHDKAMRGQGGHHGKAKAKAGNSHHGKDKAGNCNHGKDKAKAGRHAHHGGDRH